jgi:hypothetical protein
MDTKETRIAKVVSAGLW